MRQVRSFFAVIALLFTLSVMPLQGMTSLANVATSGHTVAFVHLHPNGPCPHPGGDDC